MSITAVFLLESLLILSLTSPMMEEMESALPTVEANLSLLKNSTLNPLAVNFVPQFYEEANQRKSEEEEKKKLQLTKQNPTCLLSRLEKALLNHQKEGWIQIPINPLVLSDREKAKANQHEFSSSLEIVATECVELEGSAENVLYCLIQYENCEIPINIRELKMVEQKCMSFWKKCKHKKNKYENEFEGIGELINSLAKYITNECYHFFKRISQKKEYENHTFGFFEWVKSNYNVENLSDEAINSSNKNWLTFVREDENYKQEQQKAEEEKIKKKLEEQNKINEYTQKYNLYKAKVERNVYRKHLQKRIQQIEANIKIKNTEENTLNQTKMHEFLNHSIFLNTFWKHNEEKEEKEEKNKEEEETLSHPRLNVFTSLNHFENIENKKLLYKNETNEKNESRELNIEKKEQLALEGKLMFESTEKAKSFVESLKELTEEVNERIEFLLQEEYNLETKNYRISTTNKLFSILQEIYRWICQILQNKYDTTEKTFLEEFTEELKQFSTGLMLRLELLSQRFEIPLTNISCKTQTESFNLNALRKLLSSIELSPKCKEIQQNLEKYKTLCQKIYSEIIYEKNKIEKMVLWTDKKIENIHEPFKKSISVEREIRHFLIEAEKCDFSKFPNTLLNLRLLKEHFSILLSEIKITSVLLDKAEKNYEKAKTIEEEQIKKTYEENIAVQKNTHIRTDNEKSEENKKIKKEKEREREKEKEREGEREKEKEKEREREREREREKERERERLREKEKEKEREVKEEEITNKNKKTSSDILEKKQIKEFKMHFNNTSEALSFFIKIKNIFDLASKKVHKLLTVEKTKKTNSYLNTSFFGLNRILIEIKGWLKILEQSNIVLISYKEEEKKNLEKCISENCKMTALLENNFFEKFKKPLLKHEFEFISIEILLSMLEKINMSPDCQQLSSNILKFCNESEMIIQTIEKNLKIKNLKETIREVKTKKELKEIKVNILNLKEAEKKSSKLEQQAENCNFEDYVNTLFLNSRLEQKKNKIIETLTELVICEEKINKEIKLEIEHKINKKTAVEMKEKSKLKNNRPEFETEESCAIKKKGDIEKSEELPSLNLLKEKQKEKEQKKQKKEIKTHKEEFNLEYEQYDLTSLSMACENKIKNGIEKMKFEALCNMLTASMNNFTKEYREQDEDIFLQASTVFKILVTVKINCLTKEIKKIKNKKEQTDYKDLKQEIILIKEKVENVIKQLRLHMKSNKPEIEIVGENTLSFESLFVLIKKLPLSITSQKIINEGTKYISEKTEKLENYNAEIKNEGTEIAVEKFKEIKKELEKCSEETKSLLTKLNKGTIHFSKEVEEFEEDVYLMTILIKETTLNFNFLKKILTEIEQQKSKSFEEQLEYHINNFKIILSALKISFAIVESSLSSYDFFGEKVREQIKITLKIVSSVFKSMMRFVFMVRVNFLLKNVQYKRLLININILSAKIKGILLFREEYEESLPEEGNLLELLQKLSKINPFSECFNVFEIIKNFISDEMNGINEWLKKAKNELINSTTKMEKFFLITNLEIENFNVLSKLFYFKVCYVKSESVEEKIKNTLEKKIAEIMKTKKQLSIEIEKEFSQFNFDEFKKFKLHNYSISEFETISRKEFHEILELMLYFSGGYIKIFLDLMSEKIQEDEELISFLIETCELLIENIMHLKLYFETLLQDDVDITILFDAHFLPKIKEKEELLSHLIKLLIHLTKTNLKSEEIDKPFNIYKNLLEGKERIESIKIEGEAQQFIKTHEMLCEMNFLKAKYLELECSQIDLENSKRIIQLLENSASKGSNILKEILERNEFEKYGRNEVAEEIKNKINKSITFGKKVCSMLGQISCTEK